MRRTPKVTSKRRPKPSGPNLSNPLSSKPRKPTWDSTVQDLSAHKASKEEIEWRHRIHQSKNAERAKHELYDKATGQRSSVKGHNTVSSPNKTGSARKIAALRQKLHGEKLYEVLAKSDRTLSLVKDLFGDDPKSYAGAPNVTVAPHIMKKKKALERTILESSSRGPPPTVTRSPAGIRDESILELAPGKPALNELSTSSSLDSDSDETPVASQQNSFRPTVDLKRFEQFVTEEENKPELPYTSTASNAPKPNTSHPLQSATKLHKTNANNYATTTAAAAATTTATITSHIKDKVMESSVDNSLPTVTDISAIDVDTVAGANDGDTVDSEVSNDMVGSTVQASLQFDRQQHQREASGDSSGIKRNDALKSVLNPSPHQRQQHLQDTKEPSSTVPLQGMESLVKTLTELDSELQKAESRPGRSPARVTPTRKADHESLPTGIAGVCDVLPRVVKRLLHYMDENERQLEAEMLLRGQLLQTMSDQQNLMDALTSDVVGLREKNVALRKELESTKKTLSERLAEVQKDVKLCFESYHKILMMLPVAPLLTSPSHLKYPNTVENGSHHSEPFSQAHIPTAAVSQQLSSDGSILAQPSPYKSHSSYPTSVILSPAKNKQLYQRSEAAITSVPSMSPLISVASSLSHSSVAVNASISQSSSSHVPVSAAPPPLDVTLQPRPHNTQSSPSRRISNSGLKHSNTLTGTKVPSSANNDNVQDTGNKPGYNATSKDPSSALIEQHNVRVVPAVLSFGSLSSFSVSTSSASQHSIPQSSVQLNTSTSVVPSQASITGTPSLFKPSETYNSPSIGHLGSSVSWLHPGRSSFTGTSSNTTSQWTSSTTAQPDIKEQPKSNGGWFALSNHVKATTS